MSRNWIKAAELQLSPAATPPWNLQKQDEELPFIRDRHYFMHGEIIAFTVIAIFVIFLLFLVIPCVRRTIAIPSSASHESSVSTKKRNCLLLMLRKRKADDHEQYPWPPEPVDDKNSGIQ